MKPVNFLLLSMILVTPVGTYAASGTDFDRRATGISLSQSAKALCQSVAQEGVIAPTGDFALQGMGLAKDDPRPIWGVATMGMDDYPLGLCEDLLVVLEDVVAETKAELSYYKGYIADDFVMRAIETQLWLDARDEFLEALPTPRMARTYLVIEARRLGPPDPREIRTPDSTVEPN